MTPPPVRYPLPTLVLLIVVGLIAWRGRDWFAAVTAPVRAGIDRMVSGPPVPSSDEPMRGGGEIVRKVLVLREGVPAADLPDGPPAETIRRRIFADVYDVWPLRGEPTHYRIGNRRPIGWVEAGAILPWDTRLVLRPKGDAITLRDDPESEGAGDRVAVDSVPLPVLEWRPGAVRVATWEPGEPWREVDRTGWVRIEEVGAPAFGLLLNRYELLEALRLAMGEDRPDGQTPIRLLALLGKLGEPAGWTSEQIDRVTRALPAEILDPGPTGGESAADRLARINDDWRPEVSWSGIAYQAIPIEAIPMR